MFARIAAPRASRGQVAELPELAEAKRLAKVKLTGGT